MTTAEANNTFDIYYNNLSSNQAPGLDLFEKSEYLTKALYAIVTLLYNNYEQNESSRKMLSNLVKRVSLSKLKINPSLLVSDNESLFFELPNDLMYILHEKLIGNVRCLEKYIRVKPVRHDLFDEYYRNPFQYNDSRALRLDIGDSSLVLSNNKYSEIVYKNRDNIKSYDISYIVRPKPIILSNDLISDYGSTIDGQITSNLGNISELDPMIHRDIVETAAKMAYMDYKNVK